MDIGFDGLNELDMLVARWASWWPRRSLSLLGDALKEDTRLRLEDDVASPSGEKWDPWSPAYAETRGPEHKLLYSSGDLARSMEFDVNGDTLDFGSGLPYALVHQKGSRDGNTPAREYVGVSRELEQALDDIFVADFERGW